MPMMNKPMLNKQEIRALVEATHGTPYSVLGLHATGQDMPGVVLRTMQPFAEKVDVVRGAGGPALAMLKINRDGLFELFLPDEAPFPYHFRMTGADGRTWETEDPYRFPFLLTDFDLYLFCEGTHYRTYEKMGAHPLSIAGVRGVHFAVWAPNAMRVSVVGDFNRWDGRMHPMQLRGSSGLWELFIPGLGVGDVYKFEIRGREGNQTVKADPYAFAAEMRPQSASMVWDIRHYTWQDHDWMRQRTALNLDRPVSIYEVHPGSWRRVPEENNRFLTYRELADQLIPYVKELGFTHIELLPITEHPLDASWGYQTIGYYAPTARFGTPDDFKFFVDRCHQNGLGVLLDWVPAHFPKDGHGLGLFDGSHLYEHADPRKGEHADWGTLIFNYGRNEVREFLLSSAVFWADVYHLDGLRVDAVASMLYLDYSRKPGEWMPNKFGGRENLEAVDFLKKFNELMHGEFPGFATFAEESTAWPMVSRPVYLGGLGFTYKWNMGWMHDTLDYFTKEPVHRKYHHHSITFSMLYAFTENFVLPFSHDEVVHGKASLLGKMPGDDWQKFANLRLLYGYMFAHPGKKLLFMGDEFGAWEEWNCDASLDWTLTGSDRHRQLQRLVRDLNMAYRNCGALYEVDNSWEGFQWIDFHDQESSVLAFLRRGRTAGDGVLGVFNFTPVPRLGYRMGVPLPGCYREILNTDAACYGGGNMGNLGGAQASDQPWQGFPHSIQVTLPPLAALYFRL